MFSYCIYISYAGCFTCCFVSILELVLSNSHFAVLLLPICCRVICVVSANTLSPFMVHCQGRSLHCLWTLLVNMSWSATFPMNKMCMHTLYLMARHFGREITCMLVDWQFWGESANTYPSKTFTVWCHHYCKIIACMCTRPAARRASLIADMQITIESCVGGHRFS